MALAVPAPRYEDAAIGELLGGILEGTEFGHAAGALQFAFVVPLFSKRHEKSFLALFVLQGDHGLFDVIVVCLELLLEI